MPYYSLYMYMSLLLQLQIYCINNACKEEVQMSSVPTHILYTVWSVHRYNVLCFNISKMNNDVYIPIKAKTTYPAHHAQIIPGVNSCTPDNTYHIITKLQKKPSKPTFPKVALWLSGHLAHNLRAVDKEEESSRLIGHCPSDEGLARTRGSVKEDTTRGLHTNGLEQLGMT